MPSLCFQSPHSCGSSSLLHTQSSCGQMLFPFLSYISPSHPQIPPPYTPSQPSQLFNPFFPNSQPLFDLPIGSVASHHFPFPLFLCLFYWSLWVGEEEREMKMGDSLSPYQVAVWGHRLCSAGGGGWKSAKHMRSWEHLRKEEIQKGTKCRIHQCTPFGKLIDAKNWKAGGGSWVPAKSSCAKYMSITAWS